MARKKVPSSQKAVNAGISLVPSLKREASRFAGKHNKSLTGLVRELLLRELEAAK